MCPEKKVNYMKYGKIFYFLANTGTNEADKDKLSCANLTIYDK